MSGGALYQQNQCQYKDRTISSELLTHFTHFLCTRTHSIPFWRILPLHHTLFRVCSYLSSMAPRTRRAQRMVRNQAEGGLNGSNVSLGHATAPDVNSVNVAAQDVLHNDQTPINLKGEFETSCQT